MAHHTFKKCRNHQAKAVVLKVDSRVSVGSFGGVRIDPERSVNCDSIDMEYAVTVKGRT